MWTNKESALKGQIDWGDDEWSKQCETRVLGVAKDSESVKGSWARAKFIQQESREGDGVVTQWQKGEGKKKEDAAVDDGLNAFHCSFRGSTLSLPAPPLQVTPPRKSVAIHPVIPLSLPASLTSYPPAPPAAPWPTHSFNPSTHRAVYQPLCSTHTQTLSKYLLPR